ncbi:MAG: hypothetical protein AAF519_14745 [Bacteroidota bacterium]
MRRGVGIILLVFLMAEASRSQDLSNLSAADPVNITGTISVTQIGYGAIGIDSRRDAYSFFGSGGLVFNFYGWTVPFSFSYSNQEGAFSQPFNQYALHPSFKNYTGHFGYASASYSPYTLSNHIFLGAGVEASYEKWTVKSFYGRLREEVEPTPEAVENAIYRRMGYGAQAVFNQNGTVIDFSIIRGKDDENSISFDEVDTVTVTPEENVAFSISAQRHFFKKLAVSITYSLSALTEDTQFGHQEVSSYKLYNHLGSFFTRNNSTSFFDAYKSSVNYTGTGFTIGLGYEYVDPGYTSHGAYYFVNDFRNITINASKVLMGGKINTSGSIGIQRDNLNDEKISTMRRVVGDLSLVYTPHSRLNITSTYSTFQTFTNIRSQFENINELTSFDNLDTLDYRQVSQSFGNRVNYLLSSSETRTQSLGMNATIQTARDEQGEEEQPTGNNFYLFSGNYTLGLLPQKINASLSFNYNRNTTLNLKSETLGPTLSFNKALSDNKLNFSGSASWNQSRSNGTAQGSISSLRSALRYLLKEKHNFNLGVVIVHRENPATETTDASGFTEFTTTIGYTYSFGGTIIKNIKNR